MAGNTTTNAAIRKAKRMSAQSFSIYRAEKIFTFAARRGKYINTTPKVNK
jgi:hypothetical protein